jgi:UrcA family protein
MIRNTLTGILLAAVVGVTAGVPASAQTQGKQSDITVTAPRVRERSSTGVPIETVSLSRTVSYGDLDLRTEAGKKELDNRIHQAARRACDALDKVYPLTAPDSPDCMKTTLDNSMEQVNAAVMAARQPR